MGLLVFVSQVLLALLMGVALGIERQYSQHPAGLKTNALVCVGAALFVSLSTLATPQDNSTRIAAQIVSGIGFLCGGVILREGLNVHGMNTAATVWCSAAIGTLIGSGFPLHGLAGTVIILGLHLGLKPISDRIDAMRKKAVDVESAYRLKVLCRVDQEITIRALALRQINEHAKMSVMRVSSQPSTTDGENAIVIDIGTPERADREIEEVLTRLSLESTVNTVSWEKILG